MYRAHAAMVNQHGGDYDGTEDYNDRAARDARERRKAARKARRDTETPQRDTGRYQSGYRVYRDGSYREDFGGDR